MLQNKTALVALLGKTAFLSVCESCHRNTAETETKCNYGTRRLGAKTHDIRLKELHIYLGWRWEGLEGIQLQLSII